MGFLTIVAISNDYWHEMTRNPEYLVQQIGVGMNYGTGSTSPLNDVHRAEHQNENQRRHDFEMEFFHPQGVEVFRAKHYDEPQVIVNTYGSQPLDAAELPYAISRGWLDLNPYNKEHARKIAKHLAELSAEIVQAVVKHEDDQAT